MVDVKLNYLWMDENVKNVRYQGATAVFRNIGTLFPFLREFCCEVSGCLADTCISSDSDHTQELQALSQARLSLLAVTSIAWLSL